MEVTLSPVERPTTRPERVLSMGGGVVWCVERLCGVCSFALFPFFSCHQVQGFRLFIARDNNLHLQAAWWDVRCTAAMHQLSAPTTTFAAAVLCLCRAAAKVPLPSGPVGVRDLLLKRFQLQEPLFTCRFPVHAAAIPTTSICICPLYQHFTNIYICRTNHSTISSSQSQKPNQLVVAKLLRLRS
jgi:hypothetical protein